MADFTTLETWAEGLLQKLGPGGRKRLSVHIARELRRANAVRIAAQRGPEGQAWDARKRQRKAAPVIRYLYQARDGHVRELEMSSYRRAGGRIIGYDKEAGAIRTMVGDRVLRKLTPQHGGGSIRARARKANLMMQGLRSPKYLRANGTDSKAVVEFSKRVARIAAVHHWGERDRVSPGGPEYDYPARPLLGISGQDAERIKDTILQHLAA